MTPTPETKKWYLLEREQPFAQSLLWELQRRYYEVRGVDAWRQGEVPHYVTSNPSVANSYAEIAFALLQDRQRLAPGDPAAEDDAEPLTLCELGAGSGRFAFHFLCRLLRLCEEADVAPESFRYVLTDQAESNLRFWQEHPRFQPLFARGLLDVAKFEVGRTDRLALRRSGETLTAGSLRHPLIVIANYLFDSIPQDLIYVGQETLAQCLVSVLVDADPNELDIVELIKRLQCRYDRAPISAPCYAEPELERILQGYRHTLADTHVLFPATALRCLQRLQALSRQGLLLLTADKGEYRLQDLAGRAAPRLVRHGSFSLNVNYHAFKEYCEGGGGVAMFPETPANSVTIGACLMIPDAAEHRETRRAYARHVREFSPDDFYTVIHHAEQTVAQMTAAEVLAYLRLSHYDSLPFWRYLARLTELAPGLDRDQREAVRDAVERVNELYFSLGEEPLFLNATAGLFYALREYRRALEYCARVLEIYGPNAGTLANMALCHHMLGERQQAEALAQQALAEDPDNVAMQELLVELAGSIAESTSCHFGPSAL